MRHIWIFLAFLSVVSCSEKAPNKGVSSTSPSVDSELDGDRDGHVANVDCDDNNAGVWEIARVFSDADFDGIPDLNQSAQQMCLGSVPSGLVREGTFTGKTDNCVALANPDQKNMDNDSLGDVCDADVDGDTILGTVDCNDADKNFYRWLSVYVDNDRDGFGAGSASKACIGASVPVGRSAEGNDPNDKDPSITALDADGDKRSDATDCAPNDSAKWEMVSLAMDSDRDGYTSGSNSQQCIGATLPQNGWIRPSTLVDNCQYIANVDQADLDRDKIGDACDDDMDADSHYNWSDCAPRDALNWRSEKLYFDLDRDGVPTAPVAICYGAFLPENSTTTSSSVVDNCPAVPNANQFNLDRDSLGDICDDDIDGDYVANAQDCAPYDAQLATPRQVYADLDGDGYGTNSVTRQYCSVAPPSGYAYSSGDPDDNNARITAVNKDGDALADSHDCAPTDPSRWTSRYLFVDQDQDNFPVFETKQFCYGSQVPVGYKEEFITADCNDANRQVYPGKLEDFTNRIDDNCDKVVDESITDMPVQPTSLYGNQLLNPSAGIFRMTSWNATSRTGYGDGVWNFNSQTRKFEELRNNNYVHDLKRLSVDTYSTLFDTRSFGAASDPKEIQFDLLKMQSNQMQTVGSARSRCTATDCDDLGLSLFLFYENFTLFTGNALFSLGYNFFNGYYPQILHNKEGVLSNARTLFDRQPIKLDTYSSYASYDCSASRVPVVLNENVVQVFNFPNGASVLAVEQGSWECDPLRYEKKTFLQGVRASGNPITGLRKLESRVQLDDRFKELFYYISRQYLNQNKVLFSSRSASKTLHQILDVSADGTLSLGTAFEDDTVPYSVVDSLSAYEYPYSATQKLFAFQMPDYNGNLRFVDVSSGQAEFKSKKPPLTIPFGMRLFYLGDKVYGTLIYDQTARVYKLKSFYWDVAAQ